MIVLDRVRKEYGTAPHALAALTDVSLRVPVGQYLSTIGPSGSGKSTLLNLMGGLDTPSSGRVLVGGHDLGDIGDDLRSDLRLREVGFVFQAFHLFPTFTVEENVGWPLEFLGAGWREVRARARHALAQVGVPRVAYGRHPAELSGGEQQRVAIARAFVTEPRLLLADEPTGNLDSRTGALILDLLQALNAERGLTVVLVTHSPTAARTAGRVVEMCDGRIVRDVRANDQRVVRLGA